MDGNVRAEPCTHKSAWFRSATCMVGLAQVHGWTSRSAWFGFRRCMVGLENRNLQAKNDTPTRPPCASSRRLSAQALNHPCPPERNNPRRRAAIGIGSTIRLAEPWRRLASWAQGSLHCFSHRILPQTTESSVRKSWMLMFRIPCSSNQRKPTSLRTIILRNESPVSENGLSSLAFFSSSCRAYAD